MFKKLCKKIVSLSCLIKIKIKKRITYSILILFQKVCS